ncbi:MAG: hypothetical protein J5919_06365 [Clostridia bacterium]|nr:hypothetical protein [Clostridia bacterium]
MKTKTILKNIASRVFAFLFFAAVCAVVFAFAAGFLKFSRGSHPEPDDTQPDLSGFESSIKQLESGQNVSGIGADTSQPPAISSEPDGSETVDDPTSPEAGDTTAAPQGTEAPPSLSYLKSRGYKLSWADWKSGFRLASVELGGDIAPLSALGSGTEKKVTERVPLTYEENGIEFLSYETRKVQRQSAELYMGYILIWAGKKDATELFPETELVTLPVSPETGPLPETEGGSPAANPPEGTEAAGTDTGTEAATGAVTAAPDPEPVVNVLHGQRAAVPGTDSLAIYSSEGKLIGVYPSADIIPAYTRDSEGRPLFTYGDKYLWLDEETGDFAESDYVDARDGRGLYFDYDPDFGTPDSAYKKYSVYETVTLANAIDKAHVYARFGVDWRIARALYEADPDFADIIAYIISPGHYYNLPFRMALLQAKKDIAAESREAAKTATQPPLTEAPEEPATEAPAEPLTGPASEPASETLTGQAGDASGEAPGQQAETQAATGETLPEPEDVTLPETAVADPGASGTGETSSGTEGDPGSTAVPETGSDPTEETTAGPETPSESWSADTSEPLSPGTGTMPEDTGDVTATEQLTEETTEYTWVSVEITYDAYRFAYGKTQPKADPSETSSTGYTISIYNQKTFSWATGYKYAKAYEFREGRAVTADDDGVVRVINVYGGSSVYLNRIYYPEDYDIGTYVHSFYIEPFYRDIYRLGYYYYDNGLMRIRHVETLSYNVNYYITDEDLLVDLYGKVYEIPAGFRLVSYSDGVLLLERNGLYGCYHKDGYWIAQPMYSYALPFVEGLCVLGLSDGTKGMIDTSGTVVLPFAYAEISAPSSGIISCYSEESGWQFFAKMKK